MCALTVLQADKAHAPHFIWEDPLQAAERLLSSSIPYFYSTISQFIIIRVQYLVVQLVSV